jgi:hypothetical protein
MTIENSSQENVESFENCPTLLKILKDWILIYTVATADEICINDFS